MARTGRLLWTLAAVSLITSMLLMLTATFWTAGTRAAPATGASNLGIVQNVQDCPTLQGAIFTTGPQGERINRNIYPTKESVFLNGGPDPSGETFTAGRVLYYQVTDPSTQQALTEVRTLTVAADGSFRVQLAPFADSANNEYKVTVSTVPSLPNNDCSKSDNFRVEGAAATPTPTPMPAPAPTNTPTPSAGPAPAPTNTPTPSPTSTPTGGHGPSQPANAPTPTPTHTPAPGSTPTPTPSPTSTPIRTGMPVQPTNTPAATSTPVTAVPGLPSTGAGYSASQESLRQLLWLAALLALLVALATLAAAILLPRRR